MFRVLFLFNLFDVSSVFWLFFQANLVLFNHPVQKGGHKTFNKSGLDPRTGGSVPSHELFVTTRSFGASVVASLVTCSHVVPNQTSPCRSNRLVGSSSPKEMDREMEEIRRKTHPRPGLHPPYSTCASFDPHSSFSHQIIMGFTIIE